ncbi:serine hydrolase domain-containing protein [Portibacter marinus]|uniref:serine hydrolase domain-containing protein n=1 Tax=Portibacter marinus TaxID=2898660 RepID=UPI001F2BA583|nr:serine hydrolase domain-containing protein [Portibacter marinus]
MKSLIVILMLCFLEISCNSGQHFPKNQKGTDELSTLVDSLLENYHIPSLAIGVVHHGEVVLCNAFGMADFSDEKTADSLTIYQLGSVTKMFIGHLLAQLIHSEQISLDSEVERYFPGIKSFPISPDGQKIRLIHLVTHTAEFPRYPSNLERVDPDPILGYNWEQMESNLKSLKIDTSIGHRHSYSNYGYGVLGEAMQSHLGNPLSSILKQQIFSPYGMTHTTISNQEVNESLLAKPYLEVNPLQLTQPWDMGTLSGAGNMFSNVVDMNKFMIELLKQNEVNDIQQQPYHQINEKWSYGLGCFIIDSETGVKEIYHGGDIDGYASGVHLFPEYDLGFVFLTNWGNGRIMSEVFNQIKKHLLDKYANF